MRRTCLILLSLAVIGRAFQPNERGWLDQVLSQDMFPDSACAGVGNEQSGEAGPFRWTFEHTPSESTWDDMSAPFEPQAFLAELEHVDPGAPHKAWKMRVGHGGIMYSLRSEFGEAVPPQHHDKAPWIDEVFQCVAVNLQKNFKPQAHYIHQAGTYQNVDALKEKVFYSPNLAKHCTDTECTFVSWGQHAHTPVNWIGNIMYYTRYKDCGDGLVETTYLFHNVEWKGEEPWPESEGYLNYLNAPWGGVRTSNLKSALWADNSGDKGPAVLVDTIPGFGTDSEYIPHLQDTGGYLTFAQDMPLTSTAFDIPCGDGTGAVIPCPEDEAERALVTPQFVVKKLPAQSVFHSDRDGRLVVKINFEPTISLGATGCTPCALTATSSTGATVDVFGVLHFVWAGKDMFLYPADGVTAADVATAFPVGSSLTFSRLDSKIPREENRALTFIFGQDKELTSAHDWKSSTSRARLGLAGSVQRDYTVFVVNPRPRVYPGKSYFHRQYMLIDKQVNTDARAHPLVDDVMQGGYNGGDRTGHDVVLWTRKDEDNLAGTPRVFGASDADPDNCGGAVLNEPLCYGTSVPPSFDAEAIYHIRCGSESYVGPDMYHFAPEGRNAGADGLRPYMCKGLGEGRNYTLPDWKLLGWFPTGTCRFNDAVYDDGYCSHWSPYQRTLAVLANFTHAGDYMNVEPNVCPTPLAETDPSRFWKAQPLVPGGAIAPFSPQLLFLKLHTDSEGGDKSLCGQVTVPAVSGGLSLATVQEDIISGGVFRMKIKFGNGGAQERVLVTSLETHAFNSAQTADGPLEGLPRLGTTDMATSGPPSVSFLFNVTLPADMDPLDAQKVRVSISARNKIDGGMMYVGCAKFVI